MKAHPELVEILRAERAAKNEVTYGAAKTAVAFREVDTSLGVVVITVTIANVKCFDNLSTPRTNFKLSGQRIAYKQLAALFPPVAA